MCFEKQLLNESTHKIAHSFATLAVDFLALQKLQTGNVEVLEKRSVVNW